LYLKNKKAMYKKVLTAIEGIDIFPIITLVLFFTFFVIWLVYAIKLKKPFIDEMSNMPLGDNNQQQNFSFYEKS